MSSQYNYHYEPASSMASRRIIEEDSYQTTPQATDTDTIPLYGQVTSEDLSSTFDPEIIDMQLKEEMLRRKVALQESKGAIVEVTCTSEVSEAVQFARKNHIKFVTKAGGHSTTGSSASHGGLVISLTKMRHVVTDPASKTVCVQGGAIWDDVNESTAPYGLAVVGSTASHTGVAGPTLGGGFGWLTGRYGLIADNLLSVRMVLADGTIVEASDESHQDLFWAVRGAGQAFGIVTELVFRAHDLAAPVYGGTLIFTVDRLPGILEFAKRFDEQQDEDSGLFFGLAAPSAADRTAILVLPFYNGSQEKADEFFAPLLSLSPSMNKTSMMSYKELNRVANVDPVPEGRKCFSGTKVYMPLDKHLVNDLWEHFDAIMEKYPRSRHSVLMFELIPYGKTIEVPIDATACADRGRYYNVAILLCWYDPGHDAAMHTYLRALLSKIKKSDCYAGQKENVQAYANFAGERP
ncbi:FAD-binding oxidoreductase [Aspergillus thermomutatus]|uniref:FAD-binding PCMH-type domain-containing protein n=1 Tax=Aspergillus thermomutatus TaxID=41047 RepID=A0A397G191_ASPTH|nr:uncharacterized protein CDV56_100280 [Aspergillus thermomutatus]RHZ43318.1 hypothetical protein CDV56_100280 [Aspergillus thermomutatus]